MTTDATFRALLPEFSSLADYPPETVAVWLTVASSYVDAPRWGALADLGAALLAAHNIAMGRAAQRQADAGAAPGGSVGVLSAKSVGKVSASYDTSAATIPGAGDLNLTTYGVRFARMRRQMGMGAIVL